MGRGPDPPRLPCQHRHRLRPPRPPLLPRRDRRHPSHAITTSINGPPSRRAHVANTRLGLCVAKLCHTAAVPAIDAAECQLQPGRLWFSVTNDGQPPCWFCNFVVQLAILTRRAESAVSQSAGCKLCDKAVELRRKPDEQQPVWRQLVKRHAQHANAVDWQGERGPQQQVAVREAAG